MKIKNTRHEIWSLEELERISGNRRMVDQLIRLAVYLFIIENSKHPAKITKEHIKDIGFRARQMCP